MNRGFIVTWLVAAASAVGVAACKGEPAPVGDAARGEQQYQALCASCHGPNGEGNGAPSLRDYARGEETLTRVIDERMPLGAPEKCVGDCPPSIAKYILTHFKGPLVCEAPPAAARGLRMLTRRELEATVADLLGLSASAPAPAAPSAPPCGTVTFTYDPGGRAVSRVHVAGSFNGWPGTLAAGGYALTKTGTTFSLARALPNGSHAYKLVLDESQWIPDPSNPRRAPDGFGGENSLVDVACPAPGGGGPGGGTTPPAASLLEEAFRGYPREARPDGFAFDDHGPSRVQSAPTVEAVFRMARVLADGVDVPKLMACAPGASGEACAKDFVARVGKRALRRPLSAEEQRRYEALALAGTDRTKGARLALRALLTSPSFGYRSELGEKGADGLYHLTPWELAQAVSYGVIGSMPDDALFAAAERGELATRAGREREARRLLATPRARAHLKAFALQWLGAEKIAEVEKQPALFPEDSPELRASMREETGSFFAHVVFDGSHRTSELLSASYTFVDDRLARLYGMPAVPAGRFERRDYPDKLRAGVMGHASVLGTLAHSDQSSPIRRGLFVRRALLCQELPPPPPNAGGVPKVNPGATTRERFAQHTANASCASCHQHIDPVGFGFERFDALGKVRDTENGKPIDARGDMTDVEGLGAGTHAPFSNLSELGKTLAESKAAEACMVKQLYRFTRGEREASVCATRPYEARLADRGGDLRELLVDLVSADDVGVRR